jgi:amino acid adenylation domain-containing protein
VGEVETTLARIWEKVLKLERVGRHDDFFKLGGHSLLAVTLIERMRREGFKLDVRALFVTPTLMALAAAVGGASDTIAVPPNLIPPGCAAITPAMLPLVNLSQEEIDRIVSQIPGGAANVQDIYPLAPLQEGFLFHHLMGDEGDTYLLVDQLGFDSRERLERYLDAVRSVVARHDILRTAVLWEGLSEPVQVVLRQVELPVTEIELDPADGDVQAQLYARFDPRRHRVDIRKAPPLRLCFAHDVQNDRWLLHELWHHIARDHATEEVMPSEIQACLLGQADRLPPALPFRNLVAQARLGVSAAEHEAFFREMLGDVEEPTAPFGLLDVRGDGTAIKEASQPVETALVLRLRQQARQLGVSLASLCHLAWAQVLARTSGRDDVVFGTLMFGRMQRGERTDLSIGLFMNTLPLRIRLGSEGVETSVRRVHTLLAGLLRHEHASLALAQRCSAVRAPAPLFTALLNYRHSDKVAIEQDARAGQALTGTVLLSGGDRTSYPFELTVDDFGDDLNLIAQVDESIDPQRLCAFMLAALESLTTALEQAPTMPVRCLEILPGAERRQLLVDFNDTTVAYPQEQCVHELFETQAIQTPVATALVYEEQTLGYGELNRRANQLAHYLIALGVKPDDRIAICAERSLEMVVGVLGILKAGGAYVPLDPNYPTERLAYMLKDTVPKVLLAHATTSVLTALSVVLDADAITVVDLQLDAAAWADQPATNPSRGTTGLTPEHLAYVIYTSGSTGKPKGVLVPHRPLVNTVLNFRREPGLGPDDTVVAVSSLSFDMHVGDLHVPLSVGARIVLASREVATDGSLLRALLERSGATLLQGTPATWKLLVAAGWRPPRRFKVMTEGEALPRDLAEQLLDRVDVVWNLYGPTETTVWSTCARLRRPLERIVIGRPMPNVQVYILDVHGNPTPIGVAGELYIGGAGVARGYLNRPELNAERFIADPFSAMPHARMYRTGDLGRWLPDGNIEFIGRNDFQVKIRGFRIELGEIEARLSEHASVRDAMVLAREDTPGDKRLVAYVTSTGVVSAEALRAHLTNLLPEYMVPAAYVHLDVLPLTPSGKLDRKALPAPDGTSYVTRGYEAPVGEVETTLARIWEKVLKLERVGRHDNFFELGGHSLSAIQLVAALQRHFNAQISDIFRCPSLIEQAQHFRPSGEALQQPIDRAKNSLSTGAERYEKMMTDVNYQPSIAANGPSLSGSSDPHPSFKADVSGHGRPMILIAGLASSGDTFKTTVEHFTGEYECHVLTLAGFAGVPPIDGPLLASAKRDLAEYIRANHLGKPVIVGHSLGGFLAVDLAAKHPDLVGPLVIVDSLPFFAGPWFQAKTLDDAKPMIESMHAYMSNQPREQYDAYAHTGAATKYMVTNPSDWETIKQWGLASDPKTVSNAMYELLGEDLRPQLSKITVPVLVLGSWSGQHEQLGASGMDVPRAKFEQTFEEQYQGLRTLHFAMADTARHFIMLDDPQWFFAQVDGFLRDPVKTMQQRGFRGST